MTATIFRASMLAAVVTMALTSSPNAQASPVTLLAGQSAVFNYDYGASLPAFGLQSVAFFSGIVAPTSGLTEIFGELNAIDLIFDTAGSQFPPTVASGDPRVKDAVFSVRYTAGVTVTVDPFANLIPQDTSIGAIRVVGVLSEGSNSVPEPTTLALALFGLVGSAAFKRNSLKSTKRPY